MVYDNDGNPVEREKPKPTGLKCDECGANVVFATGRFGPYMACEKYLEKKCTFTMKVNKDGLPVRKFKPFDTDIKCEKCEGPMVVRITWRGKIRKPFLSCSRYPKCRLAKDMPEELNEIGKQAMERWHEMDARNKADWKVFQATVALAEKKPTG